MEQNKIFIYADVRKNRKNLFRVSCLRIRICNYSDGNICKDFDVWCSYIGNKNYEEFDENKLNRDESGKFLNSHENITALNLHRDYKIHGEKNYFIEFK